MKPGALITGLFAQTLDGLSHRVQAEIYGATTRVAIQMRPSASAEKFHLLGRPRQGHFGGDPKRGKDRRRGIDRERSLLVGLCVGLGVGRAAFVQLNLNSSNGGSVRELEFKIDLADENAVLEETETPADPSSWKPAVCR
jgi:hypothetical protein